MFFHVAGDDPFGEFGGIVFIFVAHDGIHHVQGDGGFVRGVVNAAGRATLSGLSRAFVLDGGFKRGDVRVEVGDEVGVEAETDHRGAERGGIGLESAGGVERVLRAVIARHVEFAVESSGAKQHERVRGVADGEHVIVQQFVGDGLGFDAGFHLAAAGDLRLRQGGGGGHGGGDEGELLSADAGGRKIRGVFLAKDGCGFERSKQTGFVEVHICYPFYLSANVSLPITTASEEIMQRLAA